MSSEQAAQLEKLELFGSLMIQEWATMVDARPRYHHVINKNGFDRNEDLSVGGSALLALVVTVVVFGSLAGRSVGRSLIRSLAR